MKRILVISWFYPPINSSEGIVTYKLLRNSKYKYAVYTQKNSNLWSYGDNAEVDASEHIKSIYSKANSLEEFQDEAIEYFKNNKDKYDIVMTRSMPEECHEVGKYIKEIKPSIKWIASFGDPITKNPFAMIATPKNPYTNCRFLYRITGLAFLKKMVWNKRFGSTFEKKERQLVQLEDCVFSMADRIIFNNPYQKEYMSKNNKNNIQGKEVILPHSFDKNLYVEKEELKLKGNKIRFVYIGLLDEIRNASSLLYAISELNKVDKELGEKVVFEFYGNISDKDKLIIVNEDLIDVVRIKKPVNYADSLTIMKQSDYVIHIDANIIDIVDENIFFAAKLADYLGSGAKILGISMTDGAASDILRNVNALLMSHSPDEIRNYLDLIINHGYEIKMNPEKISEYDAVSVANNFDKMVEML